MDIGSKVGRYTVVSLVADGDLAVTYKVEADGVPYALRLLVLRDEGFSERLRRASAAQQGLDHPNLLRVIEVIKAPDGAPGVVTDFVEGVNLERFIAAGPHSPGEVLLLFRQMAEGVRAAHAAGLIHRNLKPSKILIGRDSAGRHQVRISDFLLGKVRSEAGGNAAVTQLGTTFGTPQYMSPEQFRGAVNVDERGDLFALGCLLYEMATGQRAFTGKNLLEVYNQVAACDFRPVDQVRPGLAPWIGEVVSELLRPEPEDRIQSAAALLERLNAIPIVPVPTRPPPEPRVERPEPRVERPEPRAERTEPQSRAERPEPRAEQGGPRADRRDPGSGPPAPERRAESGSKPSSKPTVWDGAPPRRGPPTLAILALSLALGLAVGLVMMVVAAVVVWWALQG